MKPGDNPLTIRRVWRGRALHINHAGSIYVSRLYNIYRSDDQGLSWVLDCAIRESSFRRAIAGLSIASRLLRHNIQALQVLADGARVAVARDGIYRAEPGEIHLRKTWQVDRGSRPINLSAHGNQLFFGEYGKLGQVGVRLYASANGGRSFEPAIELPKGAVQHIHNVVVDPGGGHCWVLAGDHEETSGIGLLSPGAGKVEWVARNNQLARAASAIVSPSHLIYGTDTELEPNHIVRLDKKSGRIEKLAPLEGGSLYATQNGPLMLISTCVEPSRVNVAKTCAIYASTDGENWAKALEFTKDIWNHKLFQFGLVVLPVIQGSHEFAAFSGQAIAGWHDRTAICHCHLPSRLARNPQLPPPQAYSGTPTHPELP